MRFDLYDTKGKLRVVDAQISLQEMWQYLGEFRTHCNVDKSAYEYTHFTNWIMKHHEIMITQVGAEPVRVDM